MIDPAIIQALTTAAQVVGPPLLEAFLNALGVGAREAVLEALERDAAALEETPRSSESIAAIIRRHRERVRAHEQARAETVRDRYALLDTTQLAIDRAARGELLTHEDRRELELVARFIGAGMRGELVPAVPHAVDPPANPFVEAPSSEG